MTNSANWCANPAKREMVYFELLVPENCQPGAVWAAVDVLREINLLARIRTPKITNPEVAWRLIDVAGKSHPLNRHTLQGEVERRYSRSPGTGPRVLLVPPLEVQSLPLLKRLIHRSTKAVTLIRHRFDAGTLLAACGTGVWFLAHAGCIDRAPIPWLYRSGFEAICPGIAVESHEPLLSLQGCVCASVPAMMPALVLHAAQIAGLADLAHAAAEKLLLNPERQALSAAMTSEQVMGRSRSMPLDNAQTWMQANASKPISMRDVALAVAISERTLGRLFRQHLDQSPAQYLQTVRVKRAQMWLEVTWRSVEEIAHDCGYEDTSAFCRMFSRVTGTSPKRYRDRLTLRGPRAVWQSNAASEIV
jgi:transcriptional regulator GlxA family with amidase domain